ncbi:MAG: 3-dehydroquinate synthase [Pseudomonadales bacterium]
MQSLVVELGERSYPIHIGAHARSQCDWVSYIRAKQVMLVSNETIAPLYLEQVLAQLKGFDVQTHILPDGEQFKDLSHVNTIFDKLLSARHNRTTTLVALGGGVIGDMTGFAAACYQRGVDFIQIPTTLLSQVDSSVGGKTGVNHPQGKNMIGAFYQPNVVVADIDSLNTLPDREIAAGLAEVIKYGLIYDATFFDWLEANIQGLFARDTDALTQAVYRSCQIKAEVVAADEKEAGIRAWLNLGHTFGHAIETHQGYGKWLHGEAVAAGTVMALELSCRLGWIERAVLVRTVAMFEHCKLPVTPPADMGAEDFLSLMAVDKKVLDGSLRLVLLRKLGEADVTADFDMAVLREMLDDYQVKGSPGTPA